MTQNKKNEFKKKSISLAEFAKVLSHPARIEILLTVAKKKECICGEIVEILPLAQSTVSQHLKELKEIGLITGEIDGLKSCYCINWKNIGKLQKLLHGFFENLNQRKQNCC
ncbi:MAG: metalloregulator ArsR/SmtB family transcription factor [Leptospiraceae bacterium]|nr:helix-turn-helix transcriptional regulator [Leptospiraceae bacterium]MCK6381074.1 metalloregulator ArsR/SmtB family transcription factor [Leptospiraceae bacterium]NUM42301.1 helix-turn-helix transcriptional regulator [Leptospiraceae bacterium]